MTLTPDPAKHIEGNSFSPALKMLATCSMLVLGYSAWRALDMGAWVQLDESAQVFIGLAMMLLAGGYWGILTSRTSIDGQCIRQTWLWHKEVRLADLTQVKLILVPGLSWLIAPRLVVRAGGLMLTTFHVADPAVLAAFKRLAYG